MNQNKSEDAAAKLAIRPARNGLGVFSLRNIRTGKPIAAIAGKKIHWRRLLKMPKRVIDNTYRFGPETYLVSDGFAEYVNHSCAPNSRLAKISGKLWLVARRDIREGEEVTFDYSTQIGADDIWKMRCNCGEAGCRGTIRALSEIPEEQFRRYRDEDSVPAYILKTL